MHLALREAKKGIGLTSPNPPVGCVIARKGVIIGKGWHKKAGLPHAEREAIADVHRRHGDRAKKELQGATMYVTLEPCSTTGKTPPCTDAIAEAGIIRVVYGAEDPNPNHAGGACRILSRQGIKVASGCCAHEARGIIRAFCKHITTGIPWVIAKAGISLDGRITRPRGESQWLTGADARNDAQRLRSRSDAIVIGAETLRSDNPRLTLRGPGLRTGKEQPWRVILTRSGNLPGRSHLFCDEFKDRTIVYKRRSLRTALKALGELGASTVLIEGGGQVLAQAFRHDLVDEVCFYLAPLISGSGTPVIDSSVFSGQSRHLDNLKLKRFGDDLRISGLIRRPLQS